MTKVIKVENLSKAYQIGNIGTGTVSRDLERYWAKLRGHDDPFLKVGELNDRSAASSTNMVWSLKDLDFEIEQGDAIGVIGRNGAGKSTLLKLLSRITSPTTGTIKIKGRIASLLEVGTGFHPELTGRENIFLNGGILGMRSAEIRKQFDAIVEFSGVEKYIDTPVKRYSSGMYVRLAFAVAAYLESDILIIDEVLAVGDAEFQKKCLGKMRDVSTAEGRTVIFVSHNMSMINQLCNKAIYLNHGLMISYESTKTAIDRYFADHTVEMDKSLEFNFEEQESSTKVQLGTFKVAPHFQGLNDFLSSKPIEISITLELTAEVLGLRIGFEVVYSATEQCVFRTYHDDDWKEDQLLLPGQATFKGTIPANLLNTGQYMIYPVIGVHNAHWLSYKNHIALINIINIEGINQLYSDSRPGNIAPIIDWQITYGID